MPRRHPSLFVATLLAGLALARPGLATEAEAPNLDPDPPQRLRAAGETLGFLTVPFVLLFFTPPPAADPPGNVRLVDKLTLKAWSFDASAFETNFAAHPFAGTYYYTTARSNRMGALESLGWASAASLLWELAEFPENVSFNDLMVTPVAGASIGESLVQLSRWLDREPTAGRRVLSGLLFPMNLINGGGPAPDEDVGGALAAHLRVVSGARIGGGGPELGVEIASRLIRMSGYGDAGRGTQLGVGGNVTGLSLGARAARSGLSDFRFDGGAALATLYHRDIGAGGSGWDFLLSGGLAYDLRWHDWGTGHLDSWSSIHIPGLGAQLRGLAGPLQVTLRADAGFTFAGVRSFALDAAPGAAPIDSLTTTQRAWGYTMGFGWSAAPRLEVAYEWLSLYAAAAIDVRYAANGSDPWPDRHPSASLTDTWSSVRGGASVALPWSDLQISASLERNVRKGTAGPDERTAGDTTGLVALGFGIR